VYEDRTSAGKERLRSLARSRRSASTSTRGGFLRIGSALARSLREARPADRPTADELFEKKQRDKRLHALASRRSRTADGVADPAAARTVAGMDPLVASRLIFSSSFARTTAPLRSQDVPVADKDVVRQPALKQRLPPARPGQAKAWRGLGFPGASGTDASGTDAGGGSEASQASSSEGGSEQGWGMGDVTFGRGDVTFGRQDQHGDALGDEHAEQHLDALDAGSHAEQRADPSAAAARVPFFSTPHGHFDTVALSFEVATPHTTLPNDLRAAANSMHVRAPPVAGVCLLDYKMQPLASATTPSRSKEADGSIVVEQEPPKGSAKGGAKAAAKSRQSARRPSLQISSNGNKKGGGGASGIPGVKFLTVSTPAGKKSAQAVRAAASSASRRYI
jgi:hypothetical protein